MCRRLLLDWRCSTLKICQRCNRKLRSQKSLDEGMGPVCKRKTAEEEAAAELEKNQLTIYEVLEYESLPSATAQS